MNCLLHVGSPLGEAMECKASLQSLLVLVHLASVHLGIPYWSSMPWLRGGGAMYKGYFILQLFCSLALFTAHSSIPSAHM